MTAVLVTIRCPRCARFLVAPAPASPEPTWFSCPHCAQPVPVVAPRDPPPLFSWEVYPHLYPPANPPKVPGPGVARLLTALLLTATVVIAGLAVGLAYEGAASLSPGGFAVRGVVEQALAGGGSGPLAGVTVNLSSESTAATTTSAVDGSFEFLHVPAGGVTLNFTKPGYAPVVVQLFASQRYSTIGVGAPVHVTLNPGEPGNVSVISLSPFGNLNGFLTSLWSASVLLAIGALVAGVGTVAAYRERRLPYAVAGAGAAIAAPVAPGLLSILGAFPVVTWFVALSIMVGAVALGLGTVRLAGQGRPPDDD